MVTQITDILIDLKKTKLRENDLLVMDFSEVETYIIFLSAPREKKSNLLLNIENIAERLRIGIQENIFNCFYPYLNEDAQTKIGYGLIIKNPMISNLRLVLQLLNESKKMGELNAKNQEFKSKFVLKRLLLEECIYTLFQPIVDINTLEIIGYEALSRGPKNTEYVSPILLFLLAAKSGLSFELDRLCRKKAFERVKDLLPNTKIFVNTLATTIHDPEFRGHYLEQLFKDMEIKPENVVFEISEKLAIDNYEIFRSALKDYTDIGIVHANDDLGSGHSDLERIMELNPGYLKVDISLIRGIDKSRIKQEIVKSMKNLAKGISSVIIAEGIETKEEYETLKALNIQYGQGFLFATPQENIDPDKKKITLKK